MNTRPLTLEEIKHTEVEILNYTVNVCKKLFDTKDLYRGTTTLTSTCPVPTMNVS